jgi:hypothetical protein
LEELFTEKLVLVFVSLLLRLLEDLIVVEEVNTGTGTRDTGEHWKFEI